MTDMMTAVRWHGRRDVRVEQIPAAPPPGAGEVRVHVGWCGICGSDVHEYRSGPFVIPTEQHPVTHQCAPIALGHEIAGWVDATGEAVEGLAPGDLVALNALLPCKACGPCQRGDFHLCRTLGHLGMSADGGLAEFVTVPAEMVVAAPDGVEPDVAALAEPFAVVVHMWRQAGRPRGTRCTVIGAGTIGLAAALVLRAEGNDVTLLDVSDERCEHARSLGFRAATPDHAEQAPVVFECSGASRAPNDAVGLTESGGLVVLAGLPEEPSTVDFNPVVLREIRLVGSMSHLAQDDMAPALRFLAAHADEASQLITARIPLERTVADGLEVLVGPDRARHAKVLVRVGG